MRCRLTIIALLLLAGIAIVLVCPLASGGADPGIKKEHLDPDAGDFVDDVTNITLLNLQWTSVAG